MTTPVRTASKTPMRPSQAIASFSEMGGDSYIRRSGRTFIVSFYGALRAIKLYPVENAAVQKALDDITVVAREILAHEHDLEMRVSGEFIFINSTRLRLDLDNYASFSHILALFRASGVGALRVHQGATERDWLVFLSLLQSTSKEAPTAR